MAVTSIAHKYIFCHAFATILLTLNQGNGILKRHLAKPSYLNGRKKNTKKTAQINTIRLILSARLCSLPVRSQHTHYPYQRRTLANTRAPNPRSLFTATNLDKDQIMSVRTYTNRAGNSDRSQVPKVHCRIRCTPPSRQMV